ncbi:MAG: AAA family ATPase [Ramlibacter sp.]|nr:AAA family ATPase [Ramlibacter sp.]
MSVLYRDHFEFSSDPFGITPDTGFFFGGGQRADILEALAVTVMHDEGIVMLVGEIGMGKTMLSRMLMDRLKAMPVDTVYLPNPVFDRNEVLEAILKDLTGASRHGSRAEALEVLQPLLIERYSEGRRVVVVIDEAHAMPPDTLEEIRLLSNLETSQHKLLKILMFGQPELESVLAARHLRQVRDRVSHRFRLRPLTVEEVGAYLDFRALRAGHHGGQLFTPQARQLLAQASAGRTRRINMLADKSLLAAYAASSGQVDESHVRLACAEESDSAIAATPRGLTQVFSHDRSRWLLAAGVGSLLGLVGMGVGWWLGHGATSLAVHGTVQREPSASAEAGVISGTAATAGIARATGPENAPRASAATVPAPPSTSAARDELPPAQDSLEEKISWTETLISSRADSGFTIQVLALKSPSREQVEAALRHYGELGLGLPILVNQRLYKGQQHHAVYLGVFGSREEAQSVLSQILTKLGGHKPLIRSFERLAKEPRP